MNADLWILACPLFNLPLYDHLQSIQYQYFVLHKFANGELGVRFGEFDACVRFGEFVFDFCHNSYTVGAVQCRPTQQQKIL